MDITTDQIREPIGRIMGSIGRKFLGNLQQSLMYLDIERSFYPLLLIEAGNGNLTQKELAHKLSCDKVQVVRIIDYLSSNGYVVRGQDINDRRKCNLVITEKARKILPDIKKAIRETTAMSLKNIPENKIEELYALLKIMDQNLSSLNADE
jgi:MarR family transcriptional regulator, transcriptional regulator for hemolysin